MITLYYMAGSCSIAPHIVLEEIGSDFNFVSLDMSQGDLDTPSFREISPSGYVPALMTDEGPLTENAAILLYLGQIHPEAKLLLTQSSFDIARINSFNVFLSNSVAEAYRALSRSSMFVDGEAAISSLRAKVPGRVERLYDIIEKRFADGRQWVHGDDYTVSDPYLFIWSSYLQWGDRGDPDRYPLVRAHRERVLARPATQRAISREGKGDPALFFSAEKSFAGID